MMYVFKDSGEGTSTSNTAPGAAGNTADKEDDNNNIFHDILLKYLDKKAPLLGRCSVFSGFTGEPVLPDECISLFSQGRQY